MTIRLLRDWNGIPTGSILNQGDAATEAALVANGTASFDLTTGNVFVPNDPYSEGISTPSMLWAQRPDVVLFRNHEICFYDVGGGSLFQGGGNKLRSNGVRWKPVNGEALLDAVDSPNTTTTAAAIQSMTTNRVFSPANLFRTYDRFQIDGGISKSGTTDATTIRVHFGPLGTTADPVVYSTTAMLAASRSLGLTNVRLKLMSNVLMRFEGNADPAGTTSGGASTTVYGTAVTISDISLNSMAFTVSSQKSGAVDTVTLEDLLIKWQATDSV